MAAAFKRFISKSAERCHPFFDLIKKGKSFAWSEESDQAFEQLKKYLSTPHYQETKRLQNVTSQSGRPAPI
jgi:hypothetical protein